jgi:hypothetical protein
VRSFGAFADAFHAELAQRRRYLCPQPRGKRHGPANCPNWSTFAFRRRHLPKIAPQQPCLVPPSSQRCSQDSFLATQCSALPPSLQLFSDFTLHFMHYTDSTARGHARGRHQDGANINWRRAGEVW